jgi:hypothetical protein
LIQFETPQGVAIGSVLWETEDMPKPKIGRPNEERKANKLLVKVKRQQAAKKAPGQDSSQASAPIVKKTAKDKQSI